MSDHTNQKLAQDRPTRGREQSASKDPPPAAQRPGAVVPHPAAEAKGAPSQGEPAQSGGGQTKPAQGRGGQGKPAQGGGGQAKPGQQKNPQPHEQPAQNRPAQRQGDVVRHPASSEARIAKPARPRARHRLVLASFVLAVLLPTAAAVGYLYTTAADQYASRTAFSIRGPENGAPVEILGAISSGLGGGGSGGVDAEIVYEFVRSQAMVEAAAEKLPLVEIFNNPEDDVVFRLGEDRSIEDLVDYWNRMTDVSFDAGSGIVQFEARAFDPESARAIAEAVLEESTRIVNDLSVQARSDAVAVAREVLEEAEDRLRGVRRELRAFRDVEQELDPTENARASLGLISALEAELAKTEVELDTQLQLIGERGPRIAVLRQQIESLRNRIASERTRIGGGGAASTEGRAYSDLVAEYEDLVVDREFAENAYVSALASFEQAQVEARRQMRYLAPHIRPTLSAEAQYPQRLLISAGVFGALLVGWAVLLLIAYNIRDRR